MKGPRPRRVTVTRYHLPDGSRCSKNTPGAVKITVQTDRWYAKIKGVRVPLGTADESAAWAELRRLLRRAAEREAGLLDDVLDQATRPLAEHVEDWLASVADRGTAARHVALLRGHVLRLAELAGWHRITDVSEDSCLAALALLMAEAPGIRCPRTGEARAVGPQTRNHYARHVKQFTRWATRRARPRRLPSDPLEGLELIGVEEDARHTRRPPTDDEIAVLFAWLEAPEQRTAIRGRPIPTRCGLTGRQRALLYATSMATGFRAGEMRSLARDSFDLEAGTVTVAASYDKRRRLVTQPLPAWLVVELKAWFDAGGGCWESLPEDHPGEILRRDLADAGVEYVRFDEADGRPLYLDFHALRHWYVTQLAHQPGISPKVLMELARHSTPTLSLKTYARANQAELRAAASAVPRPGEAARKPGEPPGEGS